MSLLIARNSAYWQYASSTRAQTVSRRFGSQTVTGDQPSSQHTPRNCSARQHCPWGARANRQSRAATQPIDVSAHRIAVAEAISQRRLSGRTGGPAAERAPQADLRRTGRSHCEGDDEDHPESGHALECSGHGGEPESQPRYRAADLEEAQTAAVLRK